MDTSMTSTPSTTHPFTSVTTLGDMVSYHEQRVQSSQGRLKLAQGALVFGMALLVYGLILVAQNNGNAMCLVLPGIGILGLGLLGWWDAKSTPDLKVAVFDAGIATTEKNKIQTMRWEEVERTYQILTRRNNTDIIQHGYRLEGANGQKVWWNDDVTTAAHVWEAMRRQVYPRLLHTLSTAFSRGDTILFGDFTANREGLTHNKKTVAWAAIRDVNVANGILTVKGERQGKQEELKTMWATIPNAELLLNLIEQQRGMRN